MIGCVQLSLYSSLLRWSSNDANVWLHGLCQLVGEFNKHTQKPVSSTKPARIASTGKRRHKTPLHHIPHITVLFAFAQIYKVAIRFTFTRNRRVHFLPLFISTPPTTDKQPASRHIFICVFSIPTTMRQRAPHHYMSNFNHGNYVCWVIRGRRTLHVFGF